MSLKIKRREGIVGGKTAPCASVNQLMVIVYWNEFDLVLRVEEGKQFFGPEECA